LVGDIYFFKKLYIGRPYIVHCRDTTLKFIIWVVVARRYYREKIHHSVDVS
jgi:hypothetical protein